MSRVFSSPEPHLGRLFLRSYFQYVKDLLMAYFSHGLHGTTLQNGRTSCHLNASGFSLRMLQIATKHNSKKPFAKTLGFGTCGGSSEFQDSIWNTSKPMQRVGTSGSSLSLSRLIAGSELEPQTFRLSAMRNLQSLSQGSGT